MRIGAGVRIVQVPNIGDPLIEHAAETIVKIPPKRAVPKPLEESGGSINMPSLPLFRADQPSLWFVQVDAAFASRCIIEQVRMYHHVLYSLLQPVLD